MVLQRLTARKEWKFFAVLPKADRGLASAWWVCLLLRGILPAAFAIAMGVLVGAVQRGNPLAGALAFVGGIFVLLQVLSPIHQAVSANLGDRTAAWLYDRLTEACVRPPGMGHLEDAKLTSDLTVARDFDLGLQALLFFGHYDKLLQLVRHLVEGAAEIGQLVVALRNLDAMHKIAFADSGCPFVEIVDGASDGAGHP